MHVPASFQGLGVVGGDDGAEHLKNIANGEEQLHSAVFRERVACMQVSALPSLASTSTRWGTSTSETGLSSYVHMDSALHTFAASSLSPPEAPCGPSPPSPAREAAAQPVRE